MRTSEKKLIKQKQTHTAQRKVFRKNRDFIQTVSKFCLFSKEKKFISLVFLYLEILTILWRKLVWVFLFRVQLYVSAHLEILSLLFYQESALRMIKVFMSLSTIIFKVIGIFLHKNGRYWHFIVMNHQFSPSHISFRIAMLMSLYMKRLDNRVFHLI